MAGFAIDTGADVFGIITAVAADTASTAAFVVESYSSTPMAKSRADAIDSQGDPAASTWYGGTGSSGDTAHEIEYTLAVKSGSFSTANLVIGAKGSGRVLRSISITTGNGEWPKITLSGRDAVAAADTAVIGTWTLPAMTLAGRKKAQALGFTTDTGCRLQGSSVEASTDEASQLDSQGAEAAYDIANGIMTISGDLVEVTAACGVTLDTTVGATFTQDPGADKSNTGYGTTSFSAEKILTRS